MATTTSLLSAAEHDESRRRVTSPLRQLRGYVRLYVGLDGLAFIVLYLALWFWIGLALDYGVFRGFTIDWVQELPREFRVGVLALLGAGLLILVLAKAVKMLRPLGNAALALVLERHFPGPLGDRLITAVELGDRRKIDRYGYSPVMVEQTVHDAVERLAGLPVAEVLEWQRLKRLGTTVALALIGPYLIAGALYAAFHHADVPGFVR